MFSRTAGYGRINIELGKAPLALDEPREAAEFSQLRCADRWTRANLYVNRADLHQLLANAYQQAQMPDSAARHRRWGRS